jgi:hypothetical protein
VRDVAVVVDRDGRPIDVHILIGEEPLEIAGQRIRDDVYGSGLERDQQRLRVGKKSAS